MAAPRERLTGMRTLCTVRPVAIDDGAAMTTSEQGLGRLEKSLEELEALVARLESGELSLDQALAEFERGVKLTRECQTALAEAEQKVEILLKRTDTAEPVPFTGPTDARS
jgi:exodeoxyribonuclease VII small subunit